MTAMRLTDRKSRLRRIESIRIVRRVRETETRPAVFLGLQ